MPREIKDIKTELNAIYTRENELKNQRRTLEKEYREQFQKEAQKNVGRCFKFLGGEKYVKIIDVPRERYLRNKIDFNEYQYPCVVVWKKQTMDGIRTSLLQEPELPIEFDTFHSNFFPESKHEMGHGWFEIVPEEFDELFRAKIDEIFAFVGIEKMHKVLLLDGANPHK